MGFDSRHNLQAGAALQFPAIPLRRSATPPGRISYRFWQCRVVPKLDGCASASIEDPRCGSAHASRRTLRRNRERFGNSISRMARSSGLRPYCWHRADVDVSRDRGGSRQAVLPVAPYDADEVAGLELLAGACSPDFPVDTDVAAAGLPVYDAAAACDHLLRAGGRRAPARLHAAPITTKNQACTPQCPTERTWREWCRSSEYAA